MANKTYIVKSGDSLSKIARDVLGDINRWPEIALLNSVASPYTIHVGQSLLLPASVTNSAGVREFDTGSIITLDPREFQNGQSLPHNPVSPPAPAKNWVSMLGWSLAIAGVLFGLAGGTSTKPRRRSPRRSTRRRR